MEPGFVRHIVAAEPSLGPSNDSPAFPEAIRQASRHIRFTWIFADAGYDAEKNHVACEELGIKALIKLNKRWFGRKWPKSRLRRRMRKSYSMRRYGRRAHAESIFSAFKRTLGSVLRARGQAAQAREMLWRVLTFDLMILRRPRGYLSTQPNALGTPNPSVSKRTRYSRKIAKDLREYGAALWTFARVEGVEPTNNGAERTVRKAVPWRKTSFGSASRWGSRFVERMLTVCESLRAHGRSILDFLVACIGARPFGAPRPSLLPMKP